MAGRLSGKVAIVTGGGAGLGAAASRRFAAEGAAVVVADIDGTSAAEVTADIRGQDGRAVACTADVGSVADTMAVAAAALQSFARIDALYCNAGVPAAGTAEHTDQATWDNALSVMLTGVWLSMRAVLPTMVRQRSGSIMVQASVAAIKGVKALAPYSAAKAGAVGLARQVAADYAEFGIRSNAICPGTVPTALFRSTIDDQVAAGLKTPRSYEQRLAKEMSHFPLGRLGEPADVANLALFLASDESAWITGQVFTVDGGYTAT